MKMVSDVKLDVDSVIIETDNNPNGNKLVLDDIYLKGQVFDFELNHPDRRDPNAPPKGSNPRYALAWSSKIRIYYFEPTEYEKAIMAFDRAIDIDPKDAIN
jgi:tetratricopeptide (TPR) repeat protein